MSSQPYTCPPLRDEPYRRCVARSLLILARAGIQRIAEAIPGVKVEEMERSRERGFCCGAGGGHMWMDESRGDRVNHLRTDQFLETRADTVGVSCPFCLQMFEEGIESKGLKGEKSARDLLEILDESLGNGSES